MVINAVVKFLRSLPKDIDDPILYIHRTDGDSSVELEWYTDPDRVLALEFGGGLDYVKYVYRVEGRGRVGKMESIPRDELYSMIKEVTG